MGSKRDTRTGAKESCVMANALSPNALPSRTSPYRECDVSDRGGKPTIDVSSVGRSEVMGRLGTAASLGPKQ